MKNKLFNSKKPIIGMIHLDYLPGQEKFLNFEYVKQKALLDLKNLEAGGVDGVIIENWKDNTFGPFVNEETRNTLLSISKLIKTKTALPVGINVLPNDYSSAFYIASKAHLDFIQSDVLSDYVRTNYSYSDANPFEIKVDISDFQKARKENKCEKKLVFASVHPKHYTMLDSLTLEESAKRAIKAGADVLVVTGDVTGQQPDFNNVKTTKSVSKNIPVFIGSGLNKNNAEQFLKVADGAIVGTAFKTKNFEKIVKGKVKSLIVEARKA